MGKPTVVTNAIREHRAHVGMSQNELAALVGVTRQTMNATEAGKYSPSLEVAFRISRVFGLTVEDIFYFDG